MDDSEGFWEYYDTAKRRTGKNPQRLVLSAEQITARYRIRFRQQGREFVAGSMVTDLVAKDQVMVETDHGPEPATVIEVLRGLDNTKMVPPHHVLLRRLTEGEIKRYDGLIKEEERAFGICLGHITTLSLPMKLIRVERFFDESKIIFYFTADSRVDFRELVKLLVSDFRTRVEMRQVGVRHETQMTGGLGGCGRELCCSSFLQKFDSVSIKMAKMQDLPLNPAKISGVCNRLLCCLTYEHETYKTLKKNMPKVGKSVRYDGRTYRIIRQVPLYGKVVAISSHGEERLFDRTEWPALEPVQKHPPKKSQKKKSQGSGNKKK